MFGISPEWLLYDGEPIASTVVVAHENDRRRLAETTPAAADTAVVAGDPSYDRLVRSRHLRSRYRDALGVRPGQKLITLATTWWHRSLMGSWPSLFREILACLPRDEYRVAGLIHPNIWHGHGPWQVHTWLADCVRAGLILAGPMEGWQALLAASDLIVGDHGATSCYGASLDLPVLLAAFPETDVAPGSVGALLGRTAGRLNRRENLRGQIERAFAEHRPGTFDALRELVTSHPGESAGRLRALFYDHLRLPEPPDAPILPVVPPETVATLRPSPVRADHVVCRLTGSTATISRYPADVTADNSGHLDAAFLVAHEDHPDPSLPAEAPIVLASPPACHDEPADVLADVLRRHSSARVAAVPHGSGGLLLTHDGHLVATSAADPAVGAALLYESLLGAPAALPRRFDVVHGTWRGPVELRSAEVQPGA